MNGQLTIDFVKAIKKQILASRYVVAKIANAESLRLYITIGKMVDDEFSKNKWGAKVNDEIASRLQQELPGLRGFSGDSIKKMRRFFTEWQNATPIWSTLSTKLEIGDDSILSTVTRESENDDDAISSTLSTKLKATDIDAFLSVPFSHHYEIILKAKNEADRWSYIKQTAQNFWSVRHRQPNNCLNQDISRFSDFQDCSFAS